MSGQKGRSGGKRPGAGRKRQLKPVFGTKAHAFSVLRKLGRKYRGFCMQVIPQLYLIEPLPTEDDLWLSLLLSEDKRIRLDTLKYLKNRAEGEPSHQVNYSVQHLIAVEEGRQLARKMLDLKNKKTLELVPVEPEPDNTAVKVIQAAPKIEQ